MDLLFIISFYQEKIRNISINEERISCSLFQKCCEFIIVLIIYPLQMLFYHVDPHLNSPRIINDHTTAVR